MAFEPDIGLISPDLALFSPSCALFPAIMALLGAITWSSEQLRRVRMEAVDEPLLQSGCAGQGQPGEDAAIEAEGNSNHGGEHSNTKNAANPFFRAQRRFMAANTRPPASRAIAREVAAPAA